MREPWLCRGCKDLQACAHAGVAALFWWWFDILVPDSILFTKLASLQLVKTSSNHILFLIDDGSGWLCSDILVIDNLLC